MENEYRWRNDCTCPNCISSRNRLGNIERTKTFDFDPDAIQIIEDVELQQLPEAVNSEIIKNSREIIYGEEEEEGALERKPGRRSEQNCDVLRNTYQLYEREDLPFPLIKIQENHRNVEHQIRHSARDCEKECKMKNDEFTRRNYEICLEKRLRLRDKKCQLMAQKQKFVQGNIFVNRKQKLCKECNSREKHLKVFNRNLSAGDPLVTDNRRSFKESRENAINNMRNFKITEIDQKSLKKKCFLLPLDHSNNNPMFRQRLNYDFPGRENDVDRTKITPEQHDKMRFENEKITTKNPLNHLAKIMVQGKFYPNDIRLPVSPVSPESGFCEKSPDINPRKPHLFAKVLRNDKILGRENNSSSESNLSQKSMMGDFNSVVIPNEYVKSHIIETPISISNNIRDIDRNKNSSDSELPHGHLVNNDNNLVKCFKNQVIEESCSSDKARYSDSWWE